MKIVYITGGSGYLGSSLAHHLVEQDYLVVNIDLVPWESDFLMNSKSTEWICADLSDSDSVMEVYHECLSNNKGCDNYGLVHMAAWKDLNASYENPFEYYRNNLQSTINSVQLAHLLNCKKVIFSSSAAVYDDSLTGGVKESDLISGNSPYGYSKVVGERIVTDMAKQYGMDSFNLRYANPMGSTGVYLDTSTSLFGNVISHLDYGFTIFGNNYPTSDGTCIRDYIDVRDVVSAHQYFLEYEAGERVNDTVNLGTGVPVSVLDVCKAVKEIHPKFTWMFGDRREGDAAGSFSDIERMSFYGFTCKYTLTESVRDLLKNMNKLKEEEALED